MSMPEWIIKRIIKDGLDIKQVVDICKSSNIHPNVNNN